MRGASTAKAARLCRLVQGPGTQPFPPASGCPLPSSWGTAGEPSGTEQRSVLSQCPAETVLECPKLQSGILLFLGTRAGGAPSELTPWCCLGIAYRRAHLTISEPRSAFLQKSPSASKTLPQRAAPCLVLPLPAGFDGRCFARFQKASDT